MREEIVHSSMEEYVSDLDKQLKKLLPQNLDNFIEVLRNAHKNDKSIFIIGNGGSATTATHFSCDLSKNTLRDLNDENEKRFRVVSLTTNIATMTAIANDLSYDEVFSQQLSNLVSNGDVLIAISAGGNSSNIIKAVQAAKKAGAIVLGIAGFDGGKLKDISDYSIVVRSNNYGVVEDMHMIIQHIITYSLKKINGLK